ncbi:MAG: tRNA (adenosine(37)-N6)-threonylcarbamoyltransferase complex transferase subunit TsaD [bacterium]
MYILGIESSCDETAVAVVKDGNQVLSNCVYSQINAHKTKGGVVPDLASRLHCKHINPLIEKSLHDANLEWSNLDAIAVTQGPGLEASLLVGISAAKTLAHCCQLPLIPVNHLHGHIYAHFLSVTPPSFPFITLLVSGGNTLLCLVKNHYDFDLIGATRDDAAGEAFDKIGRYLGLGYPAGPKIERLANHASDLKIPFPKPMLHDGLDFSFSGLKTAVMTYIDQNPDVAKEDICSNVQSTIIELLFHKSLSACKQYDCFNLAITGGVAANQTLSTYFSDHCKTEGLSFFGLPRNLCTDNAAMIATAAYYKATFTTFNSSCEVNPSLTL